MAFSQPQLLGTANVDSVEAPIRKRSYLITAFAAFAGLFYGYDAGHISGVLAMAHLKRTMGHPVRTTHDPTGHALSSSQAALVVSILFVGTFFGALIGGQGAECIGRRTTMMMACPIYAIGVAVQLVAGTTNTLAVGRLISGLGIGCVSTVVVLYISEVSPKKVRGVMVSVFQLVITTGMLIGACVDHATQHIDGRDSYRIPISLQMVWAGVLFIGLFLLPESPRYLIKQGKPEAALKALSRVRCRAVGCPYLQTELAEIKANYDYEIQITTTSWLDLFRGGIRPASNLHRVCIGLGLQMLQQLTGINFIIYYGTVFFQQANIGDAFLISIITTLVNACSTPLAFWTIERYGRRTLLIYGAVLMVICEFTIAIVGTVKPGSTAANKILIALVCIYIFAFASTWGPTGWVLIGELFPLPIRGKAVALTISSNWFWNCMLTLVAPYMVGKDQGNLGAKVFFLWGSTCCLCLVFAYFCVPETKGLSLEQVDQMMKETTPITSAAWVPHTTYAREAGMVNSEERPTDIPIIETIRFNSDFQKPKSSV